MAAPMIVTIRIEGAVVGDTTRTITTDNAETKRLLLQEFQRMLQKCRALGVRVSL